VYKVVFVLTLGPTLRLLVTLEKKEEGGGRGGGKSKQDEPIVLQWCHAGMEWHINRGAHWPCKDQGKCWWMQPAAGSSDETLPFSAGIRTVGAN
jgi:hypothetical protein